MVNQAVQVVLNLLRTWSKRSQEPQDTGALHLASLFGLSDLAESLMKNLDIDLRDGCGRTALVWTLECLAFEYKLKSVYRRLATPNFDIYNGIHIDRRLIVKDLLGSGANPNIAGYDGDTPLHLAVILGDVEIVERLFECGADIHTSNGMGNVPLVEAVRHDKELVYTKLLERGTVNICGENSRTALIEAASVGNLALVKTLLGKGAKVDLSDRTGQTALMEASKLSHARIVKFLLENQCNVDHQDHEYDTALMKACIDDHADVIELLLAADAQLDIIGRERKTALDHGGRYCGEDSIKRLLRHSTDPNIRDQHSGTVLISASNCKRPDIVSLILEDAELKPTSNFINLALSEACSDSNEKVVRLLIDHGANPNMNLKARRQFTLLSNAIYFGDDAVVLTLLEAGIDIETEDGDGKAPIHAAAARGTKTMVQSLIERGVSVNRRSSAGLFPLDYAMRREDKDTSIADLLRKQGAITEGKRLVQLMRDRSKRLD